MRRWVLDPDQTTLERLIGPDAAPIIKDLSEEAERDHVEPEAVAQWCIRRVVTDPPFLARLFAIPLASAEQLMADAATRGTI